MIVPLFAIAAPLWVFLAVAGGTALVLVTVFVTAIGGRDGRDERRRRTRLGLMAIPVGPILGAAMAWGVCTLGEINLLDVGYTYGAFVTIGGVAGLLGGAAFLVSGMIGPGGDGKACPLGSRGGSRYNTPGPGEGQDPRGRLDGWRGSSIG